MTDEQAGNSSDEARTAYGLAVRQKKKRIAGTRWYADNTREPIRDETLRDGLVALGAVTSREDLPTTSGAPRYALRRDFAALFDPALQGQALDLAISRFRDIHLSRSALARVAIMLAGAGDNQAKVEINFPNGERRHVAPGPSSFIAKAVIEVFAVSFLDRPAVLWLSESGNKVVMRDDRIAAAIGLTIEPDKNLPDMILADLGPQEPLLVFVEVVATDGAITDRRQAAIYALTDAAGVKRRNVAFLTAYRDRGSPGFKKTMAQLAWGSCAWFASEPESILVMHGGTTGLRLHDVAGSTM